MPYPRENLLPFQALGENEALKVETGTPEPNMRMRVTRVLASYASNPTGPVSVVIADTVTTLTFYLPPSAGVTQFEPEFQAAPGKKVTITLANGGATVKSSLVAFATID